MTSPWRVRAAEPAEVGRLTEIARAAKAHWGYPREWLELWRPTLTFDAASLESQWVRVAEEAGRAVAVVAVSGKAPRPELSHLWVDPPAMGRGLGRQLFTAAVVQARKLGARQLEIIADPHAEAFYLHLGAERVGEVASQPADRRLPLLVFPL
jgi:GNAT superfamily N-acetyltransferase